jgi:hypothetical protein
LEKVEQCFAEKEGGREARGGVPTVEGEEVREVQETGKLVQEALVREE